MCTEPKHYANLCRIAAIASWVICWLLGYSDVITSIWVAANWVAGIVCDALQTIFDRLPPGDSDEHPASRKPKSHASVYEGGEYRTVQDGKD